MTLLIQTLNEWGQVFCHHALWMLIQSGILVAILWGLDILLRRRIKASIRYAIWLLVLVKLVLPVDFKLPSGIGYWLHWQSEKPLISQQSPLPTLPENATPLQAAAQTDSAAILSDTQTTAINVTPTDTMSIPHPSITLSAQGWIFIIWIGGAAILACGFVWQMMAVKGIIARSKYVPEFLMEILKQSQPFLQMSTPVHLRQSEEISGPAVCGLFQPVILIPTNLLSRLDKGQFEAVLLHELSHIQRGDLWLNTVQTFFQIFYFYNPFVRLANHFIRKTREQANDERVLVCMNGRRDMYSAALVEVAAAVIGRPVFAVRLIGVAEPKNHLHERITLMMRKSIPTNSKLGLAGIFILLLLAAVLLPMAAGPTAFAGEKPKDTATKSGAAPITLEQFLSGTQKVYGEGMQGWSHADAAGCAAPYTEDAMMLFSGQNLTIGKASITSFYTKTLSEGTRILGADCSYQNIWVSGRYVFSIDKTIATVRTAQLKQLVLAYMKCLTVWEIQPDGSLKVKVDSSNYDKLPDTAPTINNKGVAAEKDCFHCPENNARIAEASKETLDKIRQFEKEFHAAFPAKDFDTIASYYAADAILLPEESDSISGREQIMAHTVSNLRRLDIQSIGDQIICAEGTEEMVFVVNTYQLRFQDTTQNNQELTIPCKGVHIWQKQSDGSWKILMDTFNGNSE